MIIMQTFSRTQRFRFVISQSNLHHDTFLSHGMFVDDIMDTSSIHSAMHG